MAKGIQKETKLVVADNSGAKMIKCFHVVGSTGTRKAALGDIVIAAVKEATPGNQVKKGDKVTAVIVRQHAHFRRDDGSYIRFEDNAAVIIKSKDDATPVGSRVFGPIARELRTLDKEKFAKILSLAPEVV